MSVKTEIWKIDSRGKIFTYISPKLSAGEKVPLVLAMNCTGGNPDYQKTPFWGYKADKTTELRPDYTDYDPYGNNPAQKSGVRWTVSDYFKNGYKNPFAEFILIDGAAHVQHSCHAQFAWDFFKHFSRNENGEIAEE